MSVKSGSERPGHTAIRAFRICRPTRCAHGGGWDPARLPSITRVEAAAAPETPEHSAATIAISRQSSGSRSDLKE